MNYSDLDILYLTTKNVPDYLQDVLYLGFCELGCNIVDYPTKGSLHGTPHDSIYNIPHLLFNQPERVLRKNPDLIIVLAMSRNFGEFSTRQNWFNFVLETVKKYPPSTKVVIVDSDDELYSFYPNLESREYDAVFKRELINPPYSNWYGINFSSVPEQFNFIPYNQRKYDVSFMATISNFFRVEVKNFLLKKAEELNLSVFVHVEKAPLNRSEYLEVLSQSKTSISVSGAGKDCYRYWEIPAKGCVMISEDHGLWIEKDFGEGQIFKFKDLNDLEKILKNIKMISNEHLEEMAISSLGLTYRWHTPIKRAKYILRKVNINVS
jgi:hypothetical protein